ncbi:MAG: hypothetical protein WA821_21850 [Anaerolineales bacterium]
MIKPTSTIDDLLSAAKLAIDTSLADAEIKALVAAYGYNDQKLAEGQKLFTAADAAVHAQGRAESAQLAASAALETAKAQAVKAYQDLAKIARATLDPTALPGLSLDRAMPQGVGAFRAAASQLFDNAASITSLAEYGYDAAKLAAESAKLTAFEDANRAQETAKTVAKAATAAQNDALTALNKWTAQYIKVARVALSGQSEMLGRLGVVSRAGPTAAQRAARQKKTVAATPSAASKAEEGPAAPVEEPALSKAEEPAQS